jgi:dihydrodipicolinate synthase/N-acetylneuraminate lyase
MESLAIRGVVGTPVTAFSPDGAFDARTTGKLIDFLINSGVAAIALPMNIGEALNLTSTERKMLAEVAVDAVDGRVPLIVNVSLAGTDEAIDLARHSEKMGAAAVIATPPYHWRPPFEALLDHFQALGRSVGIGLMAYNTQPHVGVPVTPQLVEELIESLSNFVGLKDATHDMEYFTEVARIALPKRPNFSIFLGVEYILPSMVLGGAGAFSAVGGIAPTLIRELYESTVAGDFETARQRQWEMSRLWILMKPGYPARIKAAMGLLGRQVGGVRRPLTTLSDEQTAWLRQKLDEMGIMKREPHGSDIAAAITGASSGSAPR